MLVGISVLSMSSRELSWFKKDWFSWEKAHFSLIFLSHNNVYHNIFAEWCFVGLVKSSFDRQIFVVA